MRSDIIPGGIFPAYELPDHTNTPRKLSELQGADPLILTLAPRSPVPPPRSRRRAAERPRRMHGATIRNLARTWENYNTEYEEVLAAARRQPITATPPLHWWARFAAGDLASDGPWLTHYRCVARP